MICDSCYKDVTKLRWLENGIWVCHDCLPEKRNNPVSFGDEIIFTRPDVPKEIKLTLKRAEELGKMREPKFRERAEVLMQSIESKPPPLKVDYEKDGHPSLGVLG